MEKIVANSINHVKKTLTLLSVFLLTGLIRAVGEDEVLFEEESTTIEPASTSGNGSSDALFNFDLPSNTHLLMLFLAIMLAIVFGIILYRALLKGQVTKGVHPREFFATVAFMVMGFFLLSMFFILTQSGVTSLGWFTILTGLYLFSLVIFLAMGKLSKWILVVLVLLVAIIGFQLTNMNLL